MDSSIIFEHSHYVENVLEHKFLGQLCTELWRKYPGDELQIFSAEIDNQGFDLVLNFKNVTRHVQLKTKMLNSITDKFPINQGLPKVPSGCVLLIQYEPEALEIKNYRFFGNSGGCPLPDIEQLPYAKTNRANAQGFKKLRPKIKKLPLNRFHSEMSIDEISVLLFDGRT